MYRRLLDDLREQAPDLRVAGFTATAYRLDSGRLDVGDDRLFDRIVFSYGIGEGIRDGYLSPLISKATLTKMDVSGVARRGGEFVAGALEAAVDQEAITRAAVDELVTLGAERKSWLLFAAGVGHAAHLRDEVRSRGISCEMVSGDTPSGERDRIIRDFRAGRIRCLTNCAVLTTGFDAPGVDLVGMLRPTLSTGLYVQIVGRGTRLAPGKENCLILDWAGNVRRHGPVDALNVRGTGGGTGAAVTVDTVRAKECPKCQTMVALNVMTCTACGHEWERDLTPKHTAYADGQHEILNSNEPPWIDVDRMTFRCWRKAGKPDSLRVDFWCGLTSYSVWVCLEHEGLPRRKAVEWWDRFGGGVSAPADVEEALYLSDYLVWPAQIRARKNGDWWEVIGYRWRAGRGWSYRAAHPDEDEEVAA
jgi:DNA repair protein RadD